MSERTKLLKKAVLTSVGASTSVDRIKTALNDAMQDLVKVGQGLLDDLEEKGKIKTDTVQDFLKNLQSEATKKTAEVEKTVSSKVQKTIRELGLITHEDWDEICQRLTEIEEALEIGVHPDGNGTHSGAKHSGRRKKQSS